MHIEVLKSKINKAVVEKSSIKYEGSITLPKEVIEAAKLSPYEKVDLNNMTNGNRITTYVLEGESVQINGAASCMFDVGDEIHILSYCSIPIFKSYAWRPTVINLNENNKLL